MIGVILCAPLGPIGVLCMRRTLLEGRISGFLSVFGASMVDLVYCSIAGFGIGFVSEFIVREKMMLEMVAGLILVAVGFWLIRRRKVSRVRDKETKSHIDAFSSTFLLTLAHPAPILVFAAAFASFGILGWHSDPIGTGMFVAGAFIGSALWAPVFAVTAGWWMQKIKTRHIRLIDLVSGLIILGFGLIMGVGPIIGTHV